MSKRSSTVGLGRDGPGTVVRRNGWGSGEARHGGDVEVNRGSAEQRKQRGDDVDEQATSSVMGRSQWRLESFPRETALSGGLSTESEEGAETHRLGRD
jgi:hypothetical protein